MSAENRAVGVVLPQSPPGLVKDKLKVFPVFHKRTHLISEEKI